AVVGDGEEGEGALDGQRNLCRGCLGVFANVGYRLLSHTVERQSHRRRQGHFVQRDVDADGACCCGGLGGEPRERICEINFFERGRAQVADGGAGLTQILLGEEPRAIHLREGLWWIIFGGDAGGIESHDDGGETLREGVVQITGQALAQRCI